MGTDYYKLLGVDKSASEEEIKKAYKKMVSIPMTAPNKFLVADTTLLLTGSEMASRPSS